MSYGTAATFVTFGTIMLVMGLEFTVIGFMYPDAITAPNYVSLPMLAVGVASTIFGYSLSYLREKALRTLNWESPSARI